MARTGAPWEERKADIQRMVDKGMTDGQIGAVYDTTGATVWRVRKQLGIAAVFDHRRKPIPAPAPPAPPAGEEYVDADGRKVTRYPARYADGVTPGVTARPRR